MAPSIERPRRNAAAFATRVDGLLGAVLLVMVLGIAAFQRFDQIKGAGISGVDTFEYWFYADQILHGQLHTIFNRLFAYLINAGALLVLGSQDWVLRGAVGLFCLINATLLAVVTFRLSESMLAAAAAAATYLFLPTVVVYSVVELLHMYGGFCVLVSLWALLAALSTVDISRRRRLVAMAGVGVGCGVLTHEDLVLLAVAVGLTLVIYPIDAIRRERPNILTRFQRLIDDAVMAAVGALLAFGVCMILTGVGPHTLVRSFLGLHGITSENTAERLGGMAFLSATAPRILRDFFLGACGLWCSGAAAGVVLLLSMTAWRHGLPIYRLRGFVAAAMMVLIYTLGYLLVSNAYLEGGYARLFIPLTAPVILITFAGLATLVAHRGGCLLSGLAAVTLASLLIWQEGMTIIPFPQPQSPHRRLWDAMRDQISAERRLLLPACYYSGMRWVGPGSPAYFGGQAEQLSVYFPYRTPLVTIGEEPSPIMPDGGDFQALMSQRHIGYAVVMTKPTFGPTETSQVRSYFKGVYGVDLPETVAASLPRLDQNLFPNDRRQLWSEQACAFEAKIERDQLLALGARESVSIPGIGDVFRLPGSPGNRLTPEGTLIGPNDLSFPRWNTVQGWVEAGGQRSEGLFLRGWVADSGQNKLAKIVVFVDGQEVWSDNAIQDRADVSLLLNQSEAAQGFEFTVPIQTLPSGHRTKIAVVAVSTQGHAVPLRCNPDRCEDLDFAQPTVAPVNSEALTAARLRLGPSGALENGSGKILAPWTDVKGWVEIAERQRDQERILIQGWAGDPTFGSSVRIVVLANGVEVLSDTVHLPRKDVDDFLKITMPNPVGFRFYLPLALLPNAPGPSVKIYAVSSDDRAVELACNPQRCDLPR